MSDTPRILRNVRVPMRDGVTLAADIYLPAEDAVKLAGQSDSDDLVYLGVSFYI